MRRLLFILVSFLSFTAAGFSAQPVARAAWVMRFDGDWLVAKGMPEKAMLVSLQGLRTVPPRNSTPFTQKISNGRLPSRSSSFINASTVSSSPR